MTAKKKQLLIESCEFVSKVRIPKELKESLELSKGKSGTLIVRNIPCTICNRRNLNGRIYSTQIIQAAIDEAKPLIESKQLLSQACEHPEGSFVSPTTASHVIIGAYVKPNVELMVDGKKERQDVLFMDWEVLNTQEGKNLRALLEAECSVGVSIRGVGDLDGDKVIEYSIYGCDAVGNPSSSTYTRMPVSESVQVELADREPMSEGFVVSTSSTNVVGDLEKAAVIQANLDNATYGTVVKTHTTLDSEVDPKTGATTEITTLEAETEDEVGTLDQALQMAKNAILNPTVNVDSVTIENIKDEDEAKTGGKKEAAPEYVPEEGLEMNEEEKDPTYLALKKTGYYSYDDPAKYMEYINQNADKLNDTELADANSVYDKYMRGEMSKELACHELENISGAISLRTPFELSDSAKTSVKEAKEKDPKEGKRFVLKVPNGYVSMEGNALTFKDDPKKALHFIVGKENTGLVHLSEVEKILDTMGVYDVKKYYKRDLGDISATADEQNAPVEEKAVNNVEPIAADNTQNAVLTEDTRYTATVETSGANGTKNTETVPVSATEGSAMIAEISNLWKQKSKNGQENLIVTVKDNTNGDMFKYNPKNNTLEPQDLNVVSANGGVDYKDVVAQSNGKQAAVNAEPVVNESDDDAIEQDDNKLTMTVNPDDDEPVEIEKEFDSKAQASVAKAGLEKGDIDGSVMLNEEDTPADITYDDVAAGWYVGVSGIGVIGPFASEEEARSGLEGYGDALSVEYIGPSKEAAMDEVLFTGEPEASDPVVEEPLQDSEKRVTVVLTDIDWDVDSVVTNSANNDEVNPNDMYDTVNGLPNELTITLKDEELGDEPEEAKQAILNAANNQSQYKINDATIASIQ